jgi:hypothetical protein
MPWRFISAKPRRERRSRPTPGIALKAWAPTLDAYIDESGPAVRGLKARYKELKGRGAKIVEGPAHRVYQCYEIVGEDNLGFRLAFAMDTSGPKT